MANANLSAAKRAKNDVIRDAAKEMSLSVSALVRVAVREYVRTHGA